MIKLISKYVKEPLSLTKKLLYVLTALVGILAICVLLLAILGPRDVFEEPPKPEIRDDFSERPATLDSTLDFGDHYIDSTIFLGDYTTANIVSHNLLTGTSAAYQVWSGENGDIPLDANIKNASIYIEEIGLSKPLATLLAERRPERIVITLGISNGVSYCNEEAFTDYYQSLIYLIKENSPDTIIILQSIFPITKKAEKKNPSISNERIDQANEWIYTLAETNGVHFLHTASVLKDAKGYLDSEYAESDGINLDYDGYKAVLRYIRTHGTYTK